VAVVRTALLFVWYAVLAVVSLARAVAATPVMLVWLGAEVRDDAEAMQRLERIIDRIIG
jgi:hypothetical protein